MLLTNRVVYFLSDDSTRIGSWNYADTNQLHKFFSPFASVWISFIDALCTAS